MKVRRSVLALLALAGCMPSIRVTTAFSSRFGDNDRTRMTSVYQRVRGEASPAARPANALGRPLVVAVQQTEARPVVLYDLSTRRALWTQPVGAISTPELLGDAVVVDTVAGAKLLDLETGRERRTLEHRGMQLAGAARDGDTIVLSFAVGLQGGSRRGGRVVAVDARTGSERWVHEVGGLVGRPAAMSGFAFVPWDRQNLAVLDLATGVEQARLRSTDDVLTWVFSSPEGVFYGGRGVYRWTPGSASGTRQGSAYLANPIAEVPGNPTLYRDAFLATTGARSARDKIRFAFRPARAEGEGIATQDGAIYLGYYRDVLALDAATGAVRWAQRLEDDIESLTVTATGVFAVSGDGRVRGLDPRTGAVGLVAELGAQLGAIATDLEGLALPSETVAPQGDVREQLVALIRDTDNRLVPFRGFLVGLLAQRPEEQATGDLLDLYTQRSIPGQLRQAIATALQSRRNGAQFLRDALRNHYDYLEGRGVPPLQVIAPTLVAMSARDAAPLLLEHLFDHETPREVLPDLISAVATLGEASSVEPLKRWLTLYRSDSTFGGAEQAAPLNTAVDAIFHHGDATAREWLRTFSNAAGTSPVVKTHVEELFRREAQEAQDRATQQSVSEQQAQLQTELNRLHELQDTVVNTLTDDHFDAVWNGHLDQVRDCAQAAVTRNPQLNQIRVVITLRSQVPPSLLSRNPPAQSGGGQGEPPRHPTTPEEGLAWVQRQREGLEGLHATVRLATYAPGDRQLQACMNEIINPLQFPAFREGRQEFRRVIDTRGAQATSTGGDEINGLGQDSQGRVLPWWLVSAPTLAVEQPAPPQPTPNTQRPGTGPAVTPGQRPTQTPGQTPTQTPGQTPTQTPGQTPTQRPWWEE